MKQIGNRTAPPTSRLRIIGGQWRGRKLPILNAEGLRPTGDRLRETLFNWLAPELREARCLDLFAGSGALGLEALSRGAASVVLVEMHRAAASQLRNNCTTLGATRAEVIEADAIRWLAAYTGPRFDIVFLDPPFGRNLWHQAIGALEQYQVLAPEGRVYVETPVDVELQPPASWQVHRRKAAGSICAWLFTHEPSPTGTADKW